MGVSELIDAKLGGQSFERILHAVREDREVVSKLPEDQLEFLESMLKEVKSASLQLESFIKSDDLNGVKGIAKSFQEIFLMIEDSCES